MQENQIRLRRNYRVLPELDVEHTLDTNDAAEDAYNVTYITLKVIGSHSNYDTFPQPSQVSFSTLPQTNAAPSPHHSHIGNKQVREQSPAIHADTCCSLLIYLHALM